MCLRLGRAPIRYWRALLVVVAALEEVDAVVLDKVHETVFLGDAA